MQLELTDASRQQKTLESQNQLLQTRLADVQGKMRDSSSREQVE
jgi:hypothetical protein